MTETIFYWSPRRLSPRAVEVLKIAKQFVYGDTEVNFVAVGGPAAEVLCFDLTAEHGIRTLGVDQIEVYPNAQAYLAVALKLYKDGELPALPSDWLIFDIESHSIEHRWNMPVEDYFRMGQYAWGEGQVVLTDNLEHMLAMIRSATVSSAHNGHMFDWSVLFGDDALYLDGCLDTLIHAITYLPAPTHHLHFSGKVLKSDKPESAKRFYSLENMCFQFGLEGKHGDLNELAERLGCEIGEIPLDDPDFREYGRQDVVALRNLLKALLYVAPMDDYAWREQEIAQCNAQIARNGCPVDVPAATQRRDILAVRKETLMDDLVETYGFPREGKQPWRSNAGKQAILDALADHGIVPDEDPDWPRTKTGAISLSGEALTNATKGTDAEDFGRSLAELMGQRSMAQLTLDTVQADGKVHPEILPMQRSGRFSTTKPGLTVWNDAEKFYFVPEPGQVMVGMDFSNADARIVAAYSRDENYWKRFVEDEEGNLPDGHELTGRAAFGDEVYDSDPAKYRKGAKPIGHGDNYGIQAVKLAQQMWKHAGIRVSVDEAQALLDSFHAAHPRVEEWKAECAREGESGWVRNDWGREMPVEEGRAKTQAPALKGQSGTRELLCDGLLRLKREGLLQYVKMHVHDEVIFSVPDTDLIPRLEALMSTTWKDMPFPAKAGKPAKNWAEANH